jgi:hypothetical protein
MITINQQFEKKLSKIKQTKKKNFCKIDFRKSSQLYKIENEKKSSSSNRRNRFIVYILFSYASKKNN